MVDKVKKGAKAKTTAEVEVEVEAQTEVSPAAADPYLLETLRGGLILQVFGFNGTLLLLHCIPQVATVVVAALLFPGVYFTRLRDTNPKKTDLKCSLTAGVRDWKMGSLH